MTLQELAETICAREGWKSTAEGSAFVLCVTLPSGRKQNVVLRGFEHDGDPMVRFTTRIGSGRSLDPARCRTALELNGRFPTGCLAIEQEALVMTDTRPLRTTTPESSARAVRFLATQADTYERLIYDRDEH